MSGALQQIIAAKEKPFDFLIDEKDISFFKKVYKRHSNFTMEPKEQIFGNKADFGTKVSCTLSKNGNAISQIYIIIDLPDIPYYNEIDCIAWVKNIGYAIIKNVEIEIGGIVYDRHNYDWLYINSELTIQQNQRKGHDIMIGNIPLLYELSNNKSNYRLYIPLQFWFCKKNNMILPLIALTYVDIKINVEFNSLNNILIYGPTHFIIIDEDVIGFDKYEILYQIQTDGQLIYCKYIYSKNNKFYYIKQHQNVSFRLPTNETSNNLINYRIYNYKGYYITPINNTTEQIYKSKNNDNINNLSINYASLLINYLYFENEEKKYFLSNQLEYIIDIIQYDIPKQINSSNQTIKINYKNSCKELVFITQLDYIANGYLLDIFNYSNNLINNSENLIKIIQLNIDGQECVSQREIEYYNQIQIYQYHSNQPQQQSFINCYSFAINPEEIQPTGTINLSKFQNIHLKLEMNKIVSYKNPVYIKIFAVSYNILQIKNGLAQLLF